MLSFSPDVYRSLNSFDAIMESADNWARSLSDSDKKKYSEALEHGAAVLKDPAHLKMYLHKYGQIHKSKLLLAYEQLPREIWSRDGLSVIDYGCGQGIAEMVMSDFIQTIHIDNDYIKDIHLIEPSIINLRQAEQYVHDFFMDSDIHCVNKLDNQLSEADVKADKYFVLHILSNVVDLDDFDGTKIIGLLNSDNRHYNVVLCVSPFYQENGRGERMDNFGGLLKGFKTHYSFQKHTDEWDKPYSCQIRIWSNLL